MHTHKYTSAYTQIHIYIHTNTHIHAHLYTFRYVFYTLYLYLCIHSLSVSLTVFLSVFLSFSLSLSSSINSERRTLKIGMLLIFCLKKNIVRLFLKVKVSYFFVANKCHSLVLVGFLQNFFAKNLRRIGHKYATEDTKKGATTFSMTTLSITFKMRHSRSDWVL